MAHQSSFGNAGVAASPDMALLFPSVPPLSWAGEDTGAALAESAERDLEAILQLLLARARYITGASGSTIALFENSRLVYRASSGGSAPPVGTGVDDNSGLIGECLRSRQMLTCNDTATDSLVDREHCHRLGIRSILAVPLVHDGNALGIVELTADRTSAFEQQDVANVTRLAEMIVTALHHAGAARRVQAEINTRVAELTPARTVPEPAEIDDAPKTALPAAPVETSPPRAAEISRIHTCQGCGFPVSEGRTFCLDCEQAGLSAADTVGTPNFLAKMARDAQQGWLQAHSYTIGTILMVVLTVAVLVWKLS